jgi:hypothetical protein
MNAFRMAVRGLTLVGVAAACWTVGAADNPVREARQQGWLAARDLQWGRGLVVPDPESGPCAPRPAARGRT